MTPPDPPDSSAAAQAPPPADQPEIVGASESPLHLTGAAARIPVPIDSRARSAALAGTGHEGAPKHVYLHVENIEAEKNPGTVYGIYVNLPKDAPPEQEAAHHVGNVSFFGVERARDPRGDEHGHGLRVALDITDSVRALAARGEWKDDQLHVTFRPLGLVPDDAPPGPLQASGVHTPAPGGDPPVSIGRVSLSYG
jgi:tyrosinase